MNTVFDMSETDQLLENSATYAAGFDKGDLPMPPARKVAVVACMDARLIPSRVLGLEEGDAPIRNAGGVGRESLAKVRASAFVVRKDSVRGFIYDEKTGKLSEVC